MRELPKKIIAKIPCFLCEETGDSPYHDVHGDIVPCSLCHGKGWFPEALYLER